MEYLTRDRLVGKTIRRVYQTPWDRGYFEDGSFGETRDILVLLEDGILFSLFVTDNSKEEPLPKSDRDIRDLQPADFDASCAGQRICEVVISDSFPFFVAGLLLENGVVIYWDAFSRVVSEGCIADRSCFQDKLVTYWGHKKVVDSNNDLAQN